MKPIKQRIVEPIDDPSVDVLVEGQFADAGWRGDAGWLAALSLEVLRTPTLDERGSDPARERNLKLVVGSWENSGALGWRDRALLIAYARLIGCGGKGAELEHLLTPVGSSGSADGCEVDHDRVARVFREHGADFEAALISGGWPGDYGGDAELNEVRSECRNGTVPARQAVPEIHRLMRMLVQHAKLDLAKVIDTSSLVGNGAGRTAPSPDAPWRVPDKLDRTKVDSTVPRSLTTWLIALGPTVLPLVLPEFRRQPNDACRAAFAFGVQDAIERWLYFVSGHWYNFSHVGPQLADAIEPLMDECELRGSTAGAEGAKLKRAWLWFARGTAEADPERIAGERQERILRAANEELARIRPLFARAALKPANTYARGEGHGLLAPGSARAPWEDFEWEREHFDTCVNLLYHLGGVWHGMKPLLLALRALACPSVAKDLRYWPEQRPPRVGEAPDELVQPPEPWSVVPASMINLFHAYVGKEQADDCELQELRGHLAAFCLRGLADRWPADERDRAAENGRQRTNDDMLERSPYWRLCLIRAAMALNINPEGKGHRLLDAASRLDPEPEVRDVAHEAYEKLRRAKGLPDNVSPRRSIMTALWWVRQAHLLALGVEIDADGAQRTRVKELTRTKDQERAEHQRSDIDNN